jgi:hypothetical protein
VRARNSFRHLDDVRSFKPDVTIDGRTNLKIGGTRIELIPVHGGETHDAMFISLPDQGVMFVGDFIMPYLGAPFVEEGDFQGLLAAIDVVVEKHPQHLLHGHEPLTRNFASATMLAQLKTDLVWLREQVLAAVRRGDERAAIHQANLIPPNLLGGQPDVYQPYLILREHVSDRLYDQSVGYWQPDLQASTISVGTTAQNSWLTISVCRRNNSSGLWSAWLPTANTNWPPRCLNRPEVGSRTALLWLTSNGSSTSS